FPYPLQVMADAIYRGLGVDEARRQLDLAAAPTYGEWLRQRSDLERDLLKHAIRGPVALASTPEEAAVVEFGLAVVEGSLLRLAGNSWKRFLENA
ncbi:MAG: hypothetical protein SF066_15790, partial [Thermoanaerobaculia bacterium]|nr:hypothetical protein [Thermoanaerobaculia bacterium]